MDNQFEKSPKQDDDSKSPKLKGLLNDDFSDDGDYDDPDTDKKSQDSVDQLWQAMLNNKNDEYTELISVRGDELPTTHFNEIDKDKRDSITSMVKLDP